MKNIGIHRAALLCLLTAPLAAQANWKKLSPTASPSKRANHHVAADLVSTYTFGGNLNATTFYNDLWRFNGVNWSNVSKNGTAGNPPARRWGSMTFDHARGQVLVFGGQDIGKKQIGDTWTWNGTAWKKHTPAVAPSARRWATMAYDWKNNRVILFGGFDGTNTLADTWAWDGSKWTKLAPTKSPTKRARHAMADKMAAKEIILYGGASLGAGPWGVRKDMWKWDGSNWALVPTTNAPYTTGVMTHPMYHDELRDRLVVFGGYNVSEKGDTYEFDGKLWVKRTFTTKPPARSRPGMAYIRAFKKGILFGGYGGPTAKQLGDTWEYQTNAAASVITSGTGCAGAGGIPTLTSTGLPWIDDTFELTLGNIGTGSSMLIVGLSKTTWSGVSLPFDLKAIGFAGCMLRTSMDLQLGGLTNAKMPIPNDKSLIGLNVYFQAASLASKLGVSSLTEIKIGAR